MKSALKVAVFHENYAQSGGAERVAESLAHLLPQAELLSTIVVDKRLSPYLASRHIKTSWMQRLPRLHDLYRHYVPLYPLAVSGCDTSRYGLVISSCFGFAKGLPRSPDTLHVCYCHTPPRWIWRTDDYTAREGFSQVTRLALRGLTRIAKWWDLRAATRPDLLIANSAVVAERLFCFYGRDSVVLHPPVEVQRFHLSPRIGDYFLVVSRLVGYKRIDLAIRACNRLGLPLRIIGDGPDRKRLEAIAGPTIEFLGRRSDEAVADSLSQCRALLFPGEEDFGMTPIEANASGRPVIAFSSGGALETVLDGTTGIFFDEPTEESLTRALLRFEKLEWEPSLLRLHAEGFRTEVFHERLKQTLHQFLLGKNRPDLAAAWQEHTAGPVPRKTCAALGNTLV